MEKVENKQTLTETEKADLGKAQSEITAIAAENVLGNADFIRRLVKGEPSRAEKILNKIVQIKNALTGNGATNAETAFVRKAERLFLNAIDELGGTYRNGKIHLPHDDEDKRLTSENDKNTHVSGENDGESAAEDALGENKKSPAEGEVKWSLAGKWPDGRNVYKSDYVKGTPKSIKQAALIDLVQNVWSNKPIELHIGANETITAKFNPELAERSDLAKMAYGNKKGTASDKRITLNLSGDFYAIAQDARYVGMRSEKGKVNPAHNDVSEWRYFVTDLIYEEDDGSHIACYMQIDVKRNDQGDWFYSFGIEKGTAPQTLLAVVTDNAATVPNNSLHQNEPIVKPEAQENSGEIKFSRKQNGDTVTIAKGELPRAATENAQFSTENATQDASGENKKSPAEGEVKYSSGKDKGENDYSYSALKAKDDIQIVELSSDMPQKKDGKIDRGAVIDIARKNARAQNNPNNNEKETYVYVPDLGLDVRVSRDGIEHGLKRNPEDTAIATMNIGDLLKNSVAVNELEGRTTSKKETEMSFVLLAAGKNKNGDYLARIVVDKNSKAISEISAYGLYAVNAKKEGALFMPKGNEGVEDDSSVPYLRSTISIADLLENVKRLNLANEVFSADVAQKLGVERAKGSLSNNLRFSRKAATFTHRDVNEMLSTVRNEALTFTLEDGTEIKGTIASKNGQELNTWLYDTLNTANLKDKRTLARRIADQILDALITEGKQPLKEAIGEEASALVREDLALSVAAALGDKQAQIENRRKNVHFDAMRKIAEEMRDVEKGRFYSATIYDGDTLRAIPNMLRAALKTSRAFTGSIRNTLTKVKDWYCAEDNAMMYKPVPGEHNEGMANGQVVFDKDIAAMLEQLTSGTGALSVQELEMVVDIAKHFQKLSERGIVIDGENPADQLFSILDTYRATANTPDVFEVSEKEKDPAHFILRLISLEKALPAYDLAESSMICITTNGENVNTCAKRIACSEILPEKSESLLDFLGFL